MAGITLAQAEAQLAKYLEAEDKVLQGQSYMIGNRQLNRANLSHIRDAIEYWDRKVKDLSGRGRARIVAPRW